MSTEAKTERPTPAKLTKRIKMLRDSGAEVIDGDHTIIVDKKKDDVFEATPRAADYLIQIQAAELAE